MTSADRQALFQLTGDEALASMRVERVQLCIYAAGTLVPEHHKEVPQKALSYLKLRGPQAAICIRPFKDPVP